jgi:hypothetical protein
MRNTLSKAGIAVLAGIALSSLRIVLAQQTPIPKPPASVNLSALLAAAPFRDELAQYDREIATLQYVRASTAPDPGNLLKNVQNALLSETDHAGVRATVNHRLQGLQKQEYAISERIRENGVLSDTNNVAGDVRIHALKQVSAAAAHAPNEVSSYRDDLASQNQNILQKYELMLDSGLRRAYAAKVQMLRERESLLAFNLVQKESGVRSQIRMRLQNLAPDPNERARLQSTLHMLDHQDDATIRELREKDALSLQNTRALLIAKARTAYAGMQEQIAKTDTANLAERRRISDAQTRVAAFPMIPNGAQDTRSLPKMLQEFTASENMNQGRRKVLDAFDTTRSVLMKRFARLSSIDASAKSAMNTQIDLLIRERLDLRKEITACVMRNAQKVAAQRNLGKVFPSNKAPHGSIDITAVVKENLGLLNSFTAKP